MQPSLDDFARLNLDLFAVCTLEGGFLWVSDSWTTQLGWPVGELLDKPNLACIHPADRERTLREASRLAAGTPTVRFRCRFLRRDGDWAWLEWSARMGEAGHLYAVARDVTEAVRAEERHVEVLRTMELAEELAHLGHWRLDLGSSGLVWSDEVCRIHGRDPARGALPLADAIDAYHPDDRAFVQDAVSTALERGEPFRFERRIVREDDGTTRWVRSHGIPERNIDGEITGVFGVFLDITAERERTRALAELQQRYAVAFETTLAAHWDWDLQTDTVTWSRRWFDMLGIDAPSTVGPASWFFDRIHPDDAEQVAAAVEAHLQHRARYDVEFRMVRDDRPGEVSWIRATGQALRDEAGRPYRMIGAMLDTTPTRDALEALQDQVRRAESANRAKSEFMANVSHEIRTPMNAILGLAELLELTDLDDEQRSALADMSSASRTLLRLIDDLLDLAKAEAGRLDLDVAPFDLGELLDDVRRLHRGRAFERGLELTLSGDVPSGTVLVGDAERLKQVLGNLIGNALKFTDEGGVTVEALVTGHEPGTVSVELRVRDTGEGIPVERLESLFEPFEQLDASSTRRHGGVGLGLAICRELMERMGGTLTARSTPGDGSTFTASVTLPRGTLAARRALPPRAQALPGAPTILLAEDNPVNQRVATAMLERLGCVVTVASDGREAVAHGTDGAFDMVFMDVQMPLLDGLDATRALRAGGYRGPILGLTAHAQASDRARCLRAGMDDHLTKPVSLSALRQALQHHLAAARDLAG